MGCGTAWGGRLPCKQEIRWVQFPHDPLRHLQQLILILPITRERIEDFQKCLDYKISFDFYKKFCYNIYIRNEKEINGDAAQGTVPPKPRGNSARSKCGAVSSTLTFSTLVYTSYLIRNSYRSHRHMSDFLRFNRV